MFVKGLTAKSTGSVKSSFESLSRDTKASSNPENRISTILRLQTQQYPGVILRILSKQNVSYSKYMVIILSPVLTT